MIRYKKPCDHRETYDQLRGLVDLVTCLPYELRGTPCVEIGSFSGAAARVLSLGFSEVVCVDPLGGTEVFIGTPGLDPAAVLAKFVENAEGRNIRLVRKTSDEAAADFSAASLGAVHVDGFHSYEQTARDLRNYWPKIRPGGYLLGHDYGNELTPGVTRAVDELLGGPDVLFLGWSWLVKKEEGRMA